MTYSRGGLIYALCCSCTKWYLSVADPQKVKEREERLRMARERREEAQKRRMEELQEALARHQEARKKQEDERRRKIEEMKRREEEHRITVEERRKKLIDDENVSSTYRFLVAIISKPFTAKPSATLADGFCALDREILVY
jgi:ATPase subunit of ABC transporter with duplicated ATPase domains